jgi:alpha-ketoglutarate-dependent taurine dioxygenase
MMSGFQLSKLHSDVNNHGLVVLTNVSCSLTPPELCEFLSALHNSAGRVFEFSGACKFTLGTEGRGNVPGFPQMRRLGNVPGALFCRTGLEWHSDGPGRWTALHCLQTPRDGGGDTLFASSSMSFNQLDPQQQDWASHTLVVYSSKYTAGRGSPSAVDFEHGLRMNETGTKLLLQTRTKMTAFHHSERFAAPLVHVDRKGRKFISVDTRKMEFLIVRGQHLSVPVSRCCLDTLLRQALGFEIGPSKWCPRRHIALIDDAHFKHVYRHRWSPNDLLMWDNDAILHSPTCAQPYEDGSDDPRGPYSRELLQTIYRVSKR